MKTLVVDDEITNRLILQAVLQPYGEVHIAASGGEAVIAASMAIEQGEHYDLICLDIIMPGIDGHAALKSIRSLEEKHGLSPASRAKVVMTTALSDRANIIGALNKQCDHYLVKPIDVSKLTEFLEKANLLA